METLIHVLETALPVFLTLGVGILCRRTKLLSPEGVKALKSVAVNITLPAVMFGAFATAEYSANSVGIPVVMFTICALAMVLGRIACNLLRIPGRLSPFLGTGFEAGMLGYALFALLFGAENNSQFAIVDLGQVLFVFTVYKIALSGRIGWKEALHEALVSPTIWGIAAGLLVGATGLFKALEPSGVSGILKACASFLAAPTSAIILLSIGYDLVPGEIRWRRTGKIVLMRAAIMLICLILTLLLNKVVLKGAMHTGAVVLMMTLPPPYVLPVFADTGSERANISSALSVLTLLSLVIFAILTAVFH
ncbi:MAG: hypothetical protein IKT99_04155 [Oscillospiraceae bacterium]|nr:hypothetical protein [Oscillospiraceae bacterium]